MDSPPQPLPTLQFEDFAVLDRDFDDPTGQPGGWSGLSALVIGWWLGFGAFGKPWGVRPIDWYAGCVHGLGMCWGHVQVLMPWAGVDAFGRC